MWKLCFMVLESMGGRYVKFLLLGNISFVIQNSGSCLNADTQALSGDFVLESNNVWHLFLTIYRDEHRSRKTSQFFRETSFFLYFLKVSVSQSYLAGDLTSSNYKGFFPDISLNYSGILILLLLGIHRVGAHFPLKTVFVWNMCSD